MENEILKGVKRLIQPAMNVRVFALWGEKIEN